MENVKTNTQFDANMETKDDGVHRFGIKSSYVVECLRDGEKIWEDRFHNTVMTAGLNDLLNKYLKGSAYTAVWALGLKGQGSISAADVSSSHAGWSEITTYSAGSRAQLSLGTPAAGSVDNSASVSVFTASSTATIAGAFVSNSTAKIGGTGSGDTGILYAAADFTSARVANTNDVLNITVTFTAS